MKREEKKLLKNSILLLLGNFSSKILVFLLVPLYTAILTTEEYAISDLLTTTVNLVYPLITLMISTAVLRFCLDRDGDKKQILSTGIWIEIFGIVLLFIGSKLFFETGTLAGYRMYFWAYFSSYAIYTLLLQYAKGCEKVFIYALASVCNTIVLISCNLLFLLKFDLGIKGYLMSMILAFCVTSLMLFFGCKAWKDIELPHNISKRYIRDMLQYSIPLMPNSISWWISNSSDRYILSLFRGLNELGMYAVAYKVPSIMSTVSNILISAWEISAVDEFGSENNRKFFSEIYQCYVDVLILGGTGLVLLVKPLAYILFQNNFYNAWQYVPVLIYASIFNILSSFLGTIFTTAKKTRAIFVTTMCGAGANIILNFLLIPFWGAQGAAIATAVSYILVYLARLKGSRKILKIDINYKLDFFKFFMLLIMIILSCCNNWANYIIGAVIIFFERKFIKNLILILTSKVKSKLTKNKAEKNL